MPNAYERQRVADLAEGNARAAKSLYCPKCGQPVIRGDDHDTIAARVTVDPEPIDRIGEMLARLDGRHTFTLERQRGKTARPGAHELWWRYEQQIDSNRELRGTLHRSHRCQPADIERHHADDDLSMRALW